MREQSPALGDAELRGLLGMFGLTGDKVFQDAGTLSGGEKTKLALAQLVAGRHNLLLLDEPTNNLDPPSPRGGGRRARRLAGHDGARQPRRRVRRSGSRPTGCCSCPRATLDYWSDDLLELVSMA